MATLRMQRDGSEDQVITLDAEETIMGRAADNAIPIDDPAASSRHCAILRKGNSYTLRDMNSTNGTYLNGAPITEVPLAPGDVITIGSVRLKLEGDDIDTASTKSVANTGPQDTIRTGPVRTAPAEFGVRKNTAKVWIIIGAIIAVTLGGLIAWFVRGLLG